MSNEIEDIEFDRLVNQKRHQELKTTLESISKSIQDDEIVKILSKHGALLKAVNDSIKKISEKEIKLDNSDVVAGLERMIGMLNSNFKELKEKKQVTEWEFTIVRDADGNIDKVKAKAKK